MSDTAPRQCTATTRRRAQCGRTVVPGAACCWQHYPSGAPASVKCAICFEAVGRCKRFELSCAHAFHRQCIARWIRRSAKSAAQTHCPLCRQPVSANEIASAGVHVVRPHGQIDLVHILHILEELVADFDTTALDAQLAAFADDTEPAQN